MEEGFKLIIQTVILGLAGGGVTFFYYKLQKNRELITGLCSQLSAIHADLISLRYKFNTFFIEAGQPLKEAQSTEEIANLKWRYYEDACELISKFQSIKPLLIKFIPEADTEIRKMDGHYQNFRRSIRRNEAIFQNKDGQSDDNLEQLKGLYRDVITKLTNKI